MRSGGQHLPDVLQADMVVEAICDDNRIAILLQTRHVVTGPRAYPAPLPLYPMTRCINRQSFYQVSISALVALHCVHYKNISHLVMRRLTHNYPVSAFAFLGRTTCGTLMSFSVMSGLAAPTRRTFPRGWCAVHRSLLSCCGFTVSCPFAKPSLNASVAKRCCEALLRSNVILARFPALSKRTCEAKGTARSQAWWKHCTRCPCSTSTRAGFSTLHLPPIACLHRGLNEQPRGSA